MIEDLSGLVVAKLAQPNARVEMLILGTNNVCSGNVNGFAHQAGVEHRTLVPAVPDIACAYENGTSKHRFPGRQILLRSVRDVSRGKRSTFGKPHDRIKGSFRDHIVI